MNTRIKAIAFDVFGTVVDWHGGISAEAAAVAERHGISGDWDRFAADWRAGYPHAMNRVRNGELPWTRIDGLHRLILDEVAPRHGLNGIPKAELDELNLAWHRLPAWPDSVQGLTLLKSTFTITTLSNGNFSLLTEMAKRAGLPWDCVISAELFHHYKPDRETYLGCADLLGIAPGELMLAACHPEDLRAAREHGLRTAYITRAHEHGKEARLPRVAEGEFDLRANDIVDLARQMGCDGV
ncbi:haloacid dehalogenase type II|uniref:haloacid dehalogenase type II n=1 Tax=Noviherbaspirillum sp. L7-7A TaxID=2850560 RepID=UPI001C2BB349|nr:haloacid dehalogenase type II [Noviherbaspirillum sp. L7-7A]MBV0878758.1 haloacid dehalogenase type II [Noviherbaspirillum sp. L7-7A]